MSRGMSLLVGVGVGVVSLALYQKLRQIIVDEDPEALADQLADKLKELENRLEKLPA